ncbi:MAG: hypothetical protein JXR83_19400 [Deltaproteobacteria bacterium]|nr:hypothetical protein [Deltaproteobacteria bacterium]
MKMLLLVATISVLVGGAAWSVQLALGAGDPTRAAPQPPQATPAASCCRYAIRGCGEQANVCVLQACDFDAEKKARAAFEKKHGCSSYSISSYLGTCSGEKCGIDLR